VPSFAGAVLLSRPDTQETHARRQLQTLIKVGGKIAPLGVEDGRKAMGWWHVVKPGTVGARDAHGTHGENHGLARGTSLCGKTDIITTGYPPDWRPPRGMLCPACAEQV
jgi:hypothetical protein